MAPSSLVKMQEDFLTKLSTRPNLKKDSMEKLAVELRERYRRLDIPARRAFIRQCLTMFANYENKWTGEVNLLSGTWTDASKGANDIDFTVPLLTAVIDTMIVFYTKTRPIYKAKAFRPNQKSEKLATMCQEIGNDELARMLTYSMLQREALYLATATISYRELNPEYLPHSPVIVESYKEPTTVPFVRMKCLAPGCSYTEEVFPETRLAGENPQPEEPQKMLPTDEDYEINHALGAESTMDAPTCPECLEPMEVGEPEQREERVEQQRKVRLPRLAMSIPNPTQMQTDFNAATDKESKFAIKRKMIARSVAEYYYQIDLSAADSRQTSTEGRVQERKQREPLQYSSMGLPVDITDDNAGNINEKVEEMTLWLEPCEYGLYSIDDQPVGEKYPNGCRLTMIGDKLVNERPAIKSIELIRVQQGVRPMANTGMGMVHVADMNELINNCISLDYSVLRTHGFPVRIINGKYIKQLTQALQTFIVNNLTAPNRLEDVIHTEPPSNSSGMIGQLTSKVEGYMSFVSGIADQSANMQSKMQKVMGSATGAAGVQEMMADRMGLAVQMRVEADIDTIFSILWFYQQDPRNREILAEKYDEATIDDFYKEDLRSMFYIEPVKGSDTPQLESANAFKMSSFAQLTASLTGMHQFDAPMFYDLVSKIGDSLNIPMEIGAGRKERNLAENRINRIVELYKDQEVSPGEEQEMVDPIQKGGLLAQAVMMKEKMMIAQLVETQIQATAQSPELQAKVAAAMAANPELNPQDAFKFVIEQTKSMMANKVEAYLYDWGALTESYSDWMQSNVGQASDLPVQLAVGILFSYSLEMSDQKQRFEMMKKMEMMGVDPTQAAASGDSPDNPPGSLKRDGTTGVGRPKDVHAIGENVQ